MTINKHVLQLKFFKNKLFLKNHVCVFIKNFEMGCWSSYNPLQVQPPYAGDYQYRINVRAPEGDFNLTNRLSQSHN